MKTAIIIVLTLLSAFSGNAQSSGARGTGCDTLDYFNFICLDSSVVSFRLAIVTGSIATEHVCLGSCFYCLAPVQHHSTVIVSEIRSSPKQGVTVRLPSRTYYVR